MCFRSEGEIKIFSDVGKVKGISPADCPYKKGQ
jgi:hypothetical protein